MKNKDIYEIEINFANLCGAECVICSRERGRGNSTFMQPPVFEALVSQLKDINFHMFQTSGNGEAFFNPHYLDYITTLKREFPSIPVWTYNNFSQWDPNRSDRIISEKLFDKVHVRIDSLDQSIFEKCSNLNQETVFSNLQYFLANNTDIPVTILYSNIKDYYNRCQEVFGMRPSRDFFTDEDLLLVREEEVDMLTYFQNFAKCDLDICRIGHSLWGERKKAPPDAASPCPKYDIIKSITWVCPNGDVSVCCYDDAQDAFIAGNIMETPLIDIFNSPLRAEILGKIRTRQYTDYPCTNPKCCEFPVERKM
jgi:hypothetical protein